MITEIITNGQRLSLDSEHTHMGFGYDPDNGTFFLAFDCVDKDTMITLTLDKDEMDCFTSNIAEHINEATQKTEGVRMTNDGRVIYNGVAYEFVSNRVGTTFIHAEITDINDVYRPVASWPADEEDWRKILYYDPVKSGMTIEDGILVKQLVSVDVLVSRIRDEAKKRGYDDPDYWPVRNGILDANEYVDYGDEWNDITYCDDDIRAFAEDFCADKDE